MNWNDFLSIHDDGDDIENDFMTIHDSSEVDGYGKSAEYEYGIPVDDGYGKSVEYEYGIPVDDGYGKSVKYEHGRLVYKPRPRRRRPVDRPIPEIIRDGEEIVGCEEAPERKEVEQTSETPDQRREKGVVSTNEANPLATSTCVVCMENWSDIIYVNCGHLCLCDHCSLRLDAREINKCPVCRKVGRKIVIFPC